MADYLFIRPSPDGDQASWTAVDANGRLLTPVEHGPLAAAAQAAGGRRVVMLLPGTDVVSAEAAVPVANAAKLRKMLPFALEEFLAQDVEELAFAAGPRLESGRIAAAAVAKDRLEAWIAAWQAAGLEPYAAYSEAEGVPDTPSTLTLVIEGRRIFGRRPGRPPFTLEGLSPSEAVDALRAAEEDPEQAADLKHLLVFVDAEARGAFEADFEVLQALAARTDLKLMPEGPLPRLAATLVHRPGTNLLQGPYAPKSDWPVLLRPWRLAAGLAAAALVLALVTMGGQNLALRREDRQLTELLAQSCQRLVGSASLQQCEAEVRARLAAAGAGSTEGETFLATLAAVAASSGGEGRIETLSYRNRVMDVQLVSPSVPALDEFAQRLVETQRYDARIESANPTDEGVEGRVQIVARR
ncbi:MAG TPA: type II secretion system protein GspL [Gammaproteobacteria bacterium]